jgi:UDP-N-acetyl-D-glucosamine dehydrogenase
LQKAGAEVNYNDPFFKFVGKGRKYDLQMTNTPLENLGRFDCVLIVTDHSDYDYEQIVRESQLVIDTRNATKRIEAPNIVHC